MFLYFGAKARLAPTYQAPRHDLIIEPFAGAAGYAMYWLQRRSLFRAHLHDSDETVVRIWTQLLDMDPDHLWHYPLPTHGAVSNDPIYLTGSVSSGSWGRFKARGDFQVTERQARDFARRRREMAKVLSRVQGRVTVELSEYHKAANVEATWFVDPPYQLDGQHYNSGNDLDWAALGHWCRSRQGQVIVCESMGADWMDFTPHRQNQTVRNQTSIEVVWYSHPEPNLFTIV